MFAEVKKKLGFGCMRLPFKDGEVDYDQFSKMIDMFIDNGFNYFDTARVYHKGMSEKALNKCLTSRYPRDKYLMADKLSDIFSKEEDLEPMFMDQLKVVGCGYFDFYLMHSQQANNYQKYCDCHCYEFAVRMKEKGLIKHIGISFHDNAELLERILSEKPMIEFVQLQFNYVDFDSAVESKKCYDVCLKYNKPVVVMEPVRGGRLAKLPEVSHNRLLKYGNASDASYAIRFAASFDNNFMVLSGMSTFEQLVDNVNTMKEFIPFSEDEFETIKEITEDFHRTVEIPCTGCRYCIDGCPKHINIPEIFNIYNDYMAFTGIKITRRYNEATPNGNKCKDCIHCGKCEHICPQHLPIRDNLEKISKIFD